MSFQTNIQPSLPRMGLLRALLHDFGAKTRRISRLSKRVSLHTHEAASSPGLLGRLAAWMDQLALLRNKERDILSQITSVEAKHQELRRQKKLKRSGPYFDVKDKPEPDTRNKKRRQFWFWLFVFWMMTRRSKAAAPTFKIG